MGKYNGIKCDIKYLIYFKIQSNQIGFCFQSVISWKFTRKLIFEHSHAIIIFLHSSQRYGYSESKSVSTLGTI